MCMLMCVHKRAYNSTYSDLVAYMQSLNIILYTMITQLLTLSFTTDETMYNKSLINEDVWPAYFIVKVKSNKELLGILFNDFLLFTVASRRLGPSYAASHIFDSNMQLKMYKAVSCLVMMHKM